MWKCTKINERNTPPADVVEGVVAAVAGSLVVGFVVVVVALVVVPDAAVVVVVVAVQQVEQNSRAQLRLPCNKSDENLAENVSAPGHALFAEFELEAAVVAAAASVASAATVDAVVVLADGPPIDDVVVVDDALFAGCDADVDAQAAAVVAADAVELVVDAAVFAVPVVDETYVGQRLLHDQNSSMPQQQSGAPFPQQLLSRFGVGALAHAAVVAAAEAAVIAADAVAVGAVIAGALGR
ncbi:unnamed protein product [Protopolystoma xenopodis]|uniref:Uncharacterized protein n=1 Tax=Protopolystoma xenopodis TaxID=117903 RepID=A0A3S5BAD7_9PLAT|nr:unnamed protein product [Protopolystoma xenopodis]